MGNHNKQVALKKVKLEAYFNAGIPLTKEDYHQRNSRPKPQLTRAQRRTFMLLPRDPVTRKEAEKMNFHADQETAQLEKLRAVSKAAE